MKLTNATLILKITGDRSQYMIPSSEVGVSIGNWYIMMKTKNFLGSFSNFRSTFIIFRIDLKSNEIHQ
jgi:hypothetical protein